jgi:phage-related protein
MSGKPTVTLTLAGDEAKLTDAFDRVGAASKKMSDQVGASSKEMTDAGSRFDDLAERSDTAETRFTGFYDTIGGTRDALAAWNDESLSTTDRLVALGQAGADLAGGLTGFLIPAIQSIWTKLTATTAAQWALTAAQTAWNAITEASAVAMRLLNAAFVSSPIGWLVLGIGALVAAFVVLWNKSAGFRDFFIGAWNGIKSVVGGVIDWIKGAWNGMLTFFSNLVTGIGNIFSGIGNAIKGAFKSAVNFVIDVLNTVIGFFNKIIYGINLVNPFDDIPSIPKIPKMHTGGVVPGIPGQEVLMTLQAGERVSTSRQGGGATRVTFAGDTSGAFATAFMELVRSGVIAIEGA